MTVAELIERLSKRDSNLIVVVHNGKSWPSGNPRYTTVDVLEQGYYVPDWPSVDGDFDYALGSLDPGAKPAILLY